MSLENNDDDMSMDEILASIRRIIAQDEVESQNESRRTGCKY